jgi:large subunit ribosomal protein L15
MMTMRVNDLSPPKGSKKKGKRVGRGPGSGHGKTSCRGHKGQKSRSGGSIPPGFEGGQMPLQRRLPKRGFTNIFKKSYAIINVEDLKRFKEKSQLDAESLMEAGLVKEIKNGIKLLGDGDISIPVHIKVHKASRSAIKKIEAAGGKVEIL